MRYSDKGFFGALALSNHDGNGLMFNFLLEQGREHADSSKTHKVLFGHTTGFQLEHQTVTIETKKPDSFQPNYMLMTLNNSFEAPMGFDLPVRNSSYVVASLSGHAGDNSQTNKLERKFGEYLAFDVEGHSSYNPYEEGQKSATTYPEIVRKRVLRDEFSAQVSYTGMAAYISPRPTIVLINSDPQQQGNGITLWIAWRSGLPFLMWASDVRLLDALFHSVNSNTTDEAIFYLVAPLNVVHNEVLVLNPLYLCSKHGRWRNRFWTNGGTVTAIGCLRQYLSRIKFSNLGESTQ